MTTPSIVPTGYAGTDDDYARARVDKSGAMRIEADSVSVPSGTATSTVIGLRPFNKGARFHVAPSSFYCENWGAGTTTVNFGIVYDDNVTYTNDVDAFASLSTAPQSGGFVTIDEITGMTLRTEANGWVVAEVQGAAADATANIVFNFGVAYDN